MPHYKIHHTLPLTVPQQDALASAITKLHCTLFSAPSIFVNVTFHPVTTPVYVGGQRQQTNYITGHLRPRGPENAPKLKILVQELTKIWNTEARLQGEGAGARVGGGEGRLDDPGALHNCFIMEDIVAGAEQGFLIPVAGDDGGWMQQNMEAFKKRAEAGDQSIKRLLDEIAADSGRQ